MFFIEPKKTWAGFKEGFNRGREDAKFASESAPKQFQTGFSSTWFFGIVASPSMKQSDIAMQKLVLDMKATIGLKFGYIADFTWQIYPALYMNARFSADVSAALSFGPSMTFINGEFEKIEHITETGITITFHAELAFSVGIGYKGLASVEIEAVGSFTGILPFVSLAKPSYQIGFQVDIHLQILWIIDWRGTLVEATYPEQSATAVKARTALRKTAGNAGAERTLIRFVETQNGRYMFWVEGQGSRPRLMMGQLDGAFEPKVVYEDTHDKYIYDVALWYGPYWKGTIPPTQRWDIFYAVSGGNWEGGAQIVPAGPGQGGDINGQLKELYTAMEEHSGGKEAGYTIFSQLSGDVVKEKWIADAMWFLSIGGAGGESFDYIRFTGMNSLAVSGITGADGKGVYRRVGADPLLRFDSDVESTYFDYYAFGMPSSAYAMISKQTFLTLQLMGNAQSAGLQARQNKTVNGGSTTPVMIRFPNGGVPVGVSKTLRSDLSVMGSDLIFNRFITTVRRDVKINEDDTRSTCDPYLVEVGIDGDHNCTYHIMSIDGEFNGTQPQLLELYTGSGIQRYLWWPEYGSDKDGRSVQRIRARLFDDTNRCFSPAIDLMEVPGGFNCDHLYFDAGRSALVAVDGRDPAGSLSVRIDTVPTLETFMPEYPAISQGSTFNMYFKLRNDTSIILEKANIDVAAEYVSGGEEDAPKHVALKAYDIDLRHPKQTKVTHYDYMQQDDPTEIGVSEERLNDLLLRMNADEADAYTDVGEEIALRIDPLADQADGTLHVIDHYDINGNLIGTDTIHVYDFMPGAEADFLVPVTPVLAEDLSRWSGTYALSATVKKFQFRLSTDEEGDRFGAVLGTDARGNDCYSFYRVGENGEALPLTDSEADDILNLFDPYPQQNDREFDQKDTRMDLTRQNSLEAGNRAWALAENNDYELKIRQFFHDGEEYAQIMLSNETVKAAKDITPMLVAKYTYLDEAWRETGWHEALSNVDINSGFTRTLVVPMKALTNGVKYERLRLEVTNAADPGNEASYYELNDESNRAELALKGSFAFTEQPKDQTVPEEQSAVFNCRVTGDEAPYSYQWQVRYPNGEYMALPGATDPTLRLDKIGRADTGNVYWCVVSDADGRSVMSRQAALKVGKKAPKTGDPDSPVQWAVIGAASLLLLTLTIFTNKRKRFR